MQAFLDNQPLDTRQSTLGGILNEAKSPLDARGRLVVEVSIDGQVLEESDLTQWRDHPLEDQEVRLISADPHDLAQQALEDVGEMLGQVRALQQRAAEAMQADEPTDALDQVSQALDIWRHAQLSVQQSARLLQLPLDQMTVNERPVPHIINDLAGQLTQVRDQVGNADWLGLADTLGYEMDQTAETWSAMLTELRERIEGMRTRADANPGT